MGNLNPAFIRKRPIGFGNRIEMDAQIDCQAAHGRQYVSGAQTAFHDASADLVYDLPVNGRGRCQINPDLGRSRHRCILYIYTIQVAAIVSSR